MSARGTVLFVDDDSNLRISIQRALRNESFELLVAEAAPQAFELLERSPIDVVISDQNMPGIKGTDFLAEVRRRWPQSVRMMLTGETEHEVAKRAINDGEIYRFFNKPISAVDLSFGIRSAIDLARLKSASTTALRCLRKQTDRLERLERTNPGIVTVDRNETGAIVVKSDEIPEDFESFMAELALEMERVDKT